MTTPVIYLIAGEPSGDMLGASLMAGLKALWGDEILFAGIGGEAMQAQGLTSLFPMRDLSIMGLAEVLPRIPRIMARLKQTMADIQSCAPIAVITIDSWGFCGRVQKQLKARHPAIKRFHYVAPMVWAWKKGRTKTLAKVLDLLMTLLPFEPPLFQKEGLQTVCVGHPVIENGAGQGDAIGFRTRHGLSATTPLLTVLPGSRLTEINRLLPIFAEVVATVRVQYPDCVVFIPTVEGVVDQVRQTVKGWNLPVIITLAPREKYDGFAASRAALAASGTVTLEVAMAGLPMVVGYRVSRLTAFVATKFLGLRVAYASLLNILLQAPVIPEFLQDGCRAKDLAMALLLLMEDGPVRQEQCAGLKRGVALLGGGSEILPSHKAAQTVITALKGR